VNKKPTPRRITANLPTAAVLTKAKVAAAKSNKSLAEWAGDELVKALTPKPASK